MKNKRFNNFPMRKYKFSFDGNTVTAQSTYAGEIVTAKAKCHEHDEFSHEKGMEIAAARCNAKVAKRRLAASNRALKEAKELIEEINFYHQRMAQFNNDAQTAYEEAMDRLEAVLKDTK
ncbi:MAG: hypothetical protein IJ593_02805 [Lachnospiraceae bacterium]|nr:hypothetical protein [Lachnospiraceae bacterium]